MSISRRGFLKAGGAAVAGAGAAVTQVPAAEAAMAEAGRATLTYKPKALGSASKLQANVPMAVHLSRWLLALLAVKTGAAAPGGVGPDRDIVAYSTLCTHMGCPVAYDARDEDLQVPLPLQHVRRREGRADDLRPGDRGPSADRARYSEKDGRTATSVEGLLYGRQSNVL